jgi:hypothetical protein
MAKTTRLRTATQATLQLENPDTDSGFETVTVGDWLKLIMKQQGIGSIELLNCMKREGIELTQPAIANWRRNDSPIPLDKLPKILRCLNLTSSEIDHWVYEIVSAYLPEELHPWFRDPMKDKKEKALGMLKINALDNALKDAGSAIEKAKSIYRS